MTDTVRSAAARASVGLLDADRSALAIVERLIDCAGTAASAREAWRFLGFAAVNLDELLTTHGPSEDVEMTCMLDASRPPSYRRAIHALLRRLEQVQERWLASAHAASAGPVRWTVLSPARQRAALAWLRAAWPDVLEPTHAPSFLPSRRLALLLRRLDLPSDRSGWCVAVPPALPRFVSTGARGPMVLLEELVCALAAADEVQVQVTPVRPLRRERTFAWHDLADAPADGVPSLVQLREQGPLFAIEQVGRLGAARQQQATRLVAEHPGVIESPLHWLQAGPVLGLGDLASLPAPASVRRLVARRTPAPIPPAPFTAQLSERDLLVGFPGHAFGDTVLRFVAEAVADPRVTALEATIYRVDAASQLLQHLAAAAERGVAVKITTELQARGDEARNLAWMQRLRASGVQVDAGPATLKVHAKLLLVRRGTDGPAHAFIGTGNLHAGTARAYNDYGLFTAAPDITADVGAVLDAIRGSAAPPALRMLAAAPWGLRAGMTAVLQQAVHAVRRGRRTRLYLKLNGLTDPTLIEELQIAAARGVRIGASIRGLCLARPRRDDRLRIIAPAGHMLHHARGLVLVEDAEVTAAWIGSADWRERNLDRRIEVWTPLQERAHRDFLARLLAGDARRSAGWELQPDGRYRAPGRTSSERSGG